MAESEIEIEKTEVVKKFIFKTKAFYLQLDMGETETPGKEIAVDDTENEDRIEVPDDDVEKRGTDSKTSGRKKTKNESMDIQIFEGSKNSIENIQPRSSKWCFIISLSLVALTIIYFIVGSFLAVGIKTNRYVSLAGTYSYH